MRQVGDDAYERLQIADEICQALTAMRRGHAPATDLQIDELYRLLERYQERAGLAPVDVSKRIDLFLRVKAGG